MNKQTESQGMNGTDDKPFDCIIIGAGHNGLAAGLVLARNGQRVLVLEKNNYVGGMAFAAVQATYKGPYTPGSGLCLIYTMAQEGSEGLMQRVKGGLGRLSECLAEQVAALGGEVRLKQSVKRILVEDGRATGVELKNGTQLRAAIIVSNLDKQATFNGLMAEQQLPLHEQRKVDAFTHRGAFVHMLFKLRGLPSYSRHLDKLNRIKGARFGGAMVLDPEQLQRSYESCLGGEMPEQVPLAFQIPTVADPDLAPQGYHIASAYGFYFPCEAEQSQRGKLRDQMAEKMIDHICIHMPDFRELIQDQAIFSSDHFASMQGVTNGDWTHGLLHPDQMIGERCLVDGSGHTTPVPGLYLCGASCHPGPGITFLPGYNCAHEIMASAAALPISTSGEPAPTERAA